MRTTSAERIKAAHAIAGIIYGGVWNRLGPVSRFHVTTIVEAVCKALPDRPRRKAAGRDE
jgi:hypothetical protein